MAQSIPPAQIQFLRCQEEDFELGGQGALRHETIQEKAFPSIEVCIFHRATYRLKISFFSALSTFETLENPMYWRVFRN